MHDVNSHCIQNTSFVVSIFISQVTILKNTQLILFLPEIRI